MLSREWLVKMANLEDECGDVCIGSFGQGEYNQMSEETVTIPKSEYEDLLADKRFLDSLFAAGVDSWEGFSVAQDIAAS